MGNKLYVGNLPYSVRDGDLEQAFGQFGAVTSAKVMMERDTGRSKGFGFVEMGSEAEAQAAINGMNGQPLGGRSVVVNEARPMEARPPRSGGYGGGGGGGKGSSCLRSCACCFFILLAALAVAVTVVALASSPALKSHADDAVEELKSRADVAVEQLKSYVDAAMEKIHDLTASRSPSPPPPTKIQM